MEKHEDYFGMKIHCGRVGNRGEYMAYTRRNRYCAWISTNRFGGKGARARAMDALKTKLDTMEGRKK